MSSTTTSQQLRAGTLIDERYQIVDLLGSGGFANVYRAKHVHLNRDVAIKVLHPPLTTAVSHGETFSKRFEQEAQIAAALDHPNIVGIFDYGFLPSDEPYIAMSLLEGHDLEEELVRKVTIAPERAIRLMKGCLEGVAHGHSRGIVHKDLKPSNLYLVSPDTREERLVVLDFGIARVFNDPDTKITQSGLFSGTPAYLAPEYVREQIVSPAVDVYQMGLILIEMLTGRPAVEAEGPMGYLLAHCMGRLAVDDSFFEGSLGEVLKKAISVRPDDRYGDAAAFADALQKVDVSSFVTETRTELPARQPITQDEVEAFANTLPESLLVDTLEWSEQVAEPRVTPERDGATLHRDAPATSESPAGHQPTLSVETKLPADSGKGRVIFGSAALLLLICAAIALAVLHEEPPSAPVAKGSSVEPLEEASALAAAEVQDDEDDGVERATLLASDAATRVSWIGHRAAESMAKSSAESVQDNVEKPRKKTRRTTTKTAPETATTPTPKPRVEAKTKPSPEEPTEESSEPVLFIAD